MILKTMSIYFFKGVSYCLIWIVFHTFIKFFSIADDVLTKPGTTTLIKCSSLEVLPNTIWMKGYSLIPSNQTDSLINVLLNGSLQIRNFTQNEVGTYSCFSEGKKVKSSKISIYGRYIPFLNSYDRSH